METYQGFTFFSSASFSMLRTSFLEPMSEPPMNAPAVLSVMAWKPGRGSSGAATETNLPKGASSLCRVKCSKFD